MLMPLDTGFNTAESNETLRAQQRQLVAGRRDAQMFPAGTPELSLPNGLSRHVNERGAFHYRADRLSPQKIDSLSRLGRENELLNLGRYSKEDIARRLLGGEHLLCVAEYSRDGVELRGALGTDLTIGEQKAYFDRTKEPDSEIVITDPGCVLIDRLKKRHL
jgi:hypothetical protein